jgi:hypothetical protein
MDAMTAQLKQVDSNATTATVPSSVQARLACRAGFDGVTAGIAPGYV